MADNKPTKKPIIIGGIALIYNFERWNLNLKGKPCIQECWCNFVLIDEVVLYFDIVVLALSNAILKPIKPKKINKLKLKKVSKNKEFQLKFSKKIIDIYLNLRSKNKSFTCLETNLEKVIEILRKDND